MSRASRSLQNHPPPACLFHPATPRRHPWLVAAPRLQGLGQRRHITIEQLEDDKRGRERVVVLGSGTQSPKIPIAIFRTSNIRKYRLGRLHARPRPLPFSISNRRRISPLIFRLHTFTRQHRRRHARVPHRARARALAQQREAERWRDRVLPGVGGRD